MPMSNDDDNRHTFFTRVRNSEVSKNFHRLGLLIAAIILTAGLFFMGKEGLFLRVWGFFFTDISILLGGIANGLNRLWIVFFVAIGIVRAIGWAIDKSI